MFAALCVLRACLGVSLGLRALLHTYVNVYTIAGHQHLLLTVPGVSVLQLLLLLLLIKYNCESIRTPLDSIKTLWRRTTCQTWRTQCPAAYANRIKSSRNADRRGKNISQLIQPGYKGATMMILPWSQIWTLEHHHFHSSSCNFLFQILKNRLEAKIRLICKSFIYKQTKAILKLANFLIYIQRRSRR